MKARPVRPMLRTNPSRKRSRDELDDFNIESLRDDRALASMEVIEEPIYGEGMTLIDPATGRAISAESQTGTWYEDNLEEEREAAAAAVEQQAKDELEARGRPMKSIRMDSPAPFAQVETPSTTSFVAAPAPAIDAASMMLGIGWKTIPDDDEDMKCAARGWARYIENHYPTLAGVEIIVKSEGHEAYLVQVQEPQLSWWLFKEDLTEGRLVATNWETCVANLRAAPMLFESQDSLYTARTPSLSTEVEEPNMNMMNGDTMGQPQVSTGMDLD